MEQLTLQLASGLLAGTTLALIALGLTLVFGIMHIVNLSHGEFYMLGAYFTWASYAILGNFWVSVIIGAVAAAIVGGTLLLAFSQRLAGAGPLRWALLTLGFGYVLRELVRLVFGSSFKLVTLPVQGTVPYLGGAYRVIVMCLCIGLIWAVAVFLKRAKYGILIRAVASNPEAAAVVGVATRKVFMAVAFLSAGLAGVAGALMVPISSAYPTMGLEVLIMAFVVVVVGGMGNVVGALIASLFAGELQSVLILVMKPSVAMLVVLAMLMGFLLVRREGLRGVW